MITTMLDAPRLQPTQSKSTGDSTIIITEVFSAVVVGSFSSRVWRNIICGIDH